MKIPGDSIIVKTPSPTSTAQIASRILGLTAVMWFIFSEKIYWEGEFEQRIVWFDETLFRSLSGNAILDFFSF